MGLAWLTEDSYALYFDKSVDIYRQKSLIESLSVPGLTSLKHLIAAEKGQLFAIKTKPNWDVRERELITQLDKTLGKTQFVEQQAKYRNENGGISYLSSRTGVSQVWLSEHQQVKQLTDMEKGVTQHIWLKRGELLSFVSNGQLWLQPYGENPTSLNIKGKVLSLYQGVGERLLISLTYNEQTKLIWLNVITKEQNTVLLGESNWAQYVGNERFITNTEHGYLAEIRAGSVHKIEPLSQIKLQWRYFYKPDRNGESALYFQDKQQNIWRYSLANNAEIVGHFDENALFMTDFSAIKMTMLSDNFVSESNELIKISFSH